MGVILADGAVPKSAAGELGIKLHKRVIKLPVSFVELAEAIDLVATYQPDSDAAASTLTSRLERELRKYATATIIRHVTVVAYVDTYVAPDGTTMPEVYTMIDKVMVPLLNRFRIIRQGQNVDRYVWDTKTGVWS